LALENKKRIAIVGGTGALGRGLMLRWASAGYSVVLGSRDRQKAEAVARDANQLLHIDTVSGLENVDAAASAEIVVITIPFSQHASTISSLQSVVQGKILVDVTVPLQPPNVKTVHLPEFGSAAKAAQVALGDGVRVVSAFQNIAASHLQDLSHSLDCDVLVCGNDVDAREEVIGLVEAAGMKGWHAGRIDNSVIAEALTSALIFINGKYKIDGAGIKITGADKVA
jgi:8-hydroxy-5-deazaflavin:NADPH oxidoreductase